MKRTYEPFPVGHFMTELLGREESLFRQDLDRHHSIVAQSVRDSRFLIVGGGGSIGQAVTKAVFELNPMALHVVDISENSLVELVRDIRSSLGYNVGDFRTLPLDCASAEYHAFVQAQEPYDYVLNLSALKHVRSEKDPYSLMRMLQVNVFNAEKLAIQAAEHGSRKFFCVSTDKAANPANMMGATKRIMEMFVMRLSGRIPVSSARFANVAFSDGSLLHGFDMRLAKQQPIAAPADVFRYFITEEEAGQLCLLSCVLAGNRELFFPKMGGARNLLSFSRIAESYLRAHGYEPVTCESEKEARERAGVLIPRGKWPCFFFASDTTGEKIVEEFYTSGEDVDLSRFSSIGVIRDQGTCETEKLEVFRRGVGRLTDSGQWGKEDVVSLVEELLDDFRHDDKHRYLDERM